MDLICSYLFFFSSRRRHTRWPRDWSSDVCSSDLDLSIQDLQAQANAQKRFQHIHLQALSWYGLEFYLVLFLIQLMHRRDVLFLPHYFQWIFFHMLSQAFPNDKLSQLLFQRKQLCHEYFPYFHNLSLISVFSILYFILVWFQANFPNAINSS